MSPGGPTTNQRKITTAVVVHDGETIVLGGLTKETDTQSIDKIPFLGDIPLLGRLFQTRTKQRQKQELLIIMTPYIIRSQADVRRIAQQKESERQEFLERFSAFADEGQYDAHVDYSRKRGLLEEVNVTAIAAARRGRGAARRRSGRSSRCAPTARSLAASRVKMGYAARIVEGGSIMRSFLALSLVAGLTAPAWARPDGNNDRPPPPSMMRQEVQMRMPVDGRGDTPSMMRQSRPEPWQRAERPQAERPSTQRMDCRSRATSRRRRTPATRAT